MAVNSPFELAQAIEACAYAAVDHTDPWTINRHGVVIGEIAWDNCECGQLVVTEDRRFPSRSFPLEEVDHTAECGAPWLVVQYTLSMVRCVAGPDSNGNPPAVAALQVSAQQNSKDMTDVRAAVLCCLNTLYDSHQLMAYELGAMEVVGPNGGCAGFTFTIIAGWTNDCGCDS